jgi:hypothetical protein
MVLEGDTLLLFVDSVLHKLISLIIYLSLRIKRTVARVELPERFSFMNLLIS